MLFTFRRLLFAGALALLALFALPVAAQFSCRTDSLGVTRCSDGSSYRTDFLGVTRDNQGNSWRTDSLGVTRGSNGTSCRTDSLGVMRCN